ncbi:MAG: sulfotransferase family 2 domain-containing protein [Prochlorococcaceae cyanobacterium]
MLICHRHRFIFLKTQKTAGTAIEIALRSLMDRGDVITPISREDEHLSRQLGCPGPHNFRAPLHHYRGPDLARLVGRARLKKRFYNHIPAAQVKAQLPESIWNSYLKISVERNPFDKAISSYYWRTRKLKQAPPISEYLRSCPRSELSSWDIYTINDILVTEVMLRYETLVADLQQLAQRLALEGGLTLPAQRPKGQHRRDSRPWQEALDAASQERIRTICAREIEAFHY